MTTASTKIFLILLALFLFGCDFDDVPPEDTVFKDYQETNLTNEPINEPKAKPPVPLERYAESPVVDESDYLIGSWNIQIFGEKKAGSAVMPTIVDIIYDYDILAIQEVRDKSGIVIGILNEIPGYDIRFSPRLGRTSSKEQYLFMISDRVQVTKCDTYPDPHDAFEREPFVCSFTIDDQTITLIQVHIKPDDAEQEMRHLDAVVSWTKAEFDEWNIFILGDLNADCIYFDSFEVFDGYEVLIPNDADTTIGISDCAYDRILATDIDSRFLEAGVDDLSSETGGDKELLLALSDHYPVFMIFDRVVS